MIKETTVGKMKTIYLTEEDVAETEEYFQHAVIISSKQTESRIEIQAPQVKSTISEEPTSAKTNISNGKFDQYLMESIDETLSSLGEVVKNAVFGHLGNEFQIDKADIPQKIVDFSKVIHKVFGLGADRLELKIVKSLSSKLQVDVQLTEYEWPLSKWIVCDVSFTDNVQNLRGSYVKATEKIV
jgi:hypothetical protein